MALLTGSVILVLKQPAPARAVVLVPHHLIIIFDVVVSLYRVMGSINWWLVLYRIY